MVETLDPVTFVFCLVVPYPSPFGVPVTTAGSSPLRKLAAELSAFWQYGSTAIGTDSWCWPSSANDMFRVRGNGSEGVLEERLCSHGGDSTSGRRTRGRQDGIVVVYRSWLAVRYAMEVELGAVLKIEVRSETAQVSLLKCSSQNTEREGPQELYLVLRRISNGLEEKLPSRNAALRRVDTRDTQHAFVLRLKRLRHLTQRSARVRTSYRGRVAWRLVREFRACSIPD